VPLPTSPPRAVSHAHEATTKVPPRPIPRFHLSPPSSSVWPSISPRVFPPSRSESPASTFHLDRRHSAHIPTPSKASADMPCNNRLRIMDARNEVEAISSRLFSKSARWQARPHPRPRTQSAAFGDQTLSVHCLPLASSLWRAIVLLLRALFSSLDVNDRAVKRSPARAACTSTSRSICLSLSLSLPSLSFQKRLPGRPDRALRLRATHASVWNNEMRFGLERRRAPRLSELPCPRARSR
jgi:hypothetical protein